VNAPISPFRLNRRQALTAALGTLGGIIIGGRALLPPRRAPTSFSDGSAAIAPSLLPRTERHSFVSGLLRRSVSYFVYQPPGYQASSPARYPALYMLHGLGGDNTEWARYGLLVEADRLMQRGDIPPFLIVLPEGDRAYWVDHANGGPAWGSYMAREVVAEIEGRFPAQAGQAHRAIGGVSMGAHGALQLALNFPGTFGVVGAHTPVLRAYAEAPAYFGSLAYFAAHTPVSLVRAHPDAARSLVMWIDIGAQDPWFRKALAFHEELIALRVAHEWHVYPGRHTGSYWAAHIPSYLVFYGSALGRV
jgi:enterochelin esterase-like enzyme